MPKLLLAFLILAVIASCKKGKDATNPLIGKWKQTEYFETSMSSSSPACRCWKPVVEFGASYVEFRVNGTFKLTPPSYVSALYCANKYTLNNDNTVSIVWGCNMGYDTTMIHKYTIEDSQLILEWPSGPPEYKLKFKKVGL